MRHSKRGRKLNRTPSHRKAMVRNLVTGLFEHGRVVTSPAKAKEARPFAEKLITCAKHGTLAHRRRAVALLHDKRVVARLFEEIAPRYADRPGGYSRILHLDRKRLGDAGPLCLFELVEEEIRKKGRPRRVKAKVKAAAQESEEGSAKEPSTKATSEGETDAAASSNEAGADT